LSNRAARGNKRMRRLSTERARLHVDAPPQLAMFDEPAVDRTGRTKEYIRERWARRRADEAARAPAELADHQAKLNALLAAATRTPRRTYTTLSGEVMELRPGEHYEPFRKMEPWMDALRPLRADGLERARPRCTCRNWFDEGAGVFRAPDWQPDEDFKRRAREAAERQHAEWLRNPHGAVELAGDAEAAR
jgi:hypothetical protein